MALGTTQRRDVRERGWFVLGRVFEDAELDALSRAYDAVLGHPLRLGEDGSSLVYRPREVALRVDDDWRPAFRTVASPKNKGGR